MRWTRCPKGIRKNKEAVAETIENNVRKLIIDEQPINPKYYEKMSELLDALIEQRRQEALDYQEYLAEIVELTKTGEERPERRRRIPARSTRRPSGRCTTTSARTRRWRWRWMQAVRHSRQDDWRSNPFKVKKVRNAIRRRSSRCGEASTPTSSAADVVRERRPSTRRTPSEALEARLDES